MVVVVRVGIRPEYYTKFDCGMGYAAAVSEDYSDDAMKILASYQPKVIGRVLEKKRIARVVMENQQFGDRIVYV